MAKFRRKPVVIEAEQMRTAGVVADFLHNNVEIPYEAGDWIVTGIKGERYAVKDEVFRATYEPVEEETKG